MERVRTALRWLLGLVMVGAGVAHFAMPAPFLSIMPPWVPFHAAMVAISGVAEIALGSLLLVPRTARPASLGLVALYIAVFPANLYMAMEHIQMAGAAPMPAWAAWLRLPLQLVFIAWALWVGKGPRAAQARA